jgi:hypothetical protein
MEGYCLYFKRRPTKWYPIACELAKVAHSHLILDNLISDDDSENHMVCYTEEQIDDLNLMLGAISSAGLTEGIIGYDILGIDAKYVEGLCQYRGNIHYLNVQSRETGNWRWTEVNEESRKIAHFCNWQIRLDRSPGVVDVARNIIMFLTKRLSISEEQLAQMLRQRYMLPIQHQYETAVKRVRQKMTDQYDLFNLHPTDQKPIRDALRAKEKETYARVFESLLIRGAALSNWKSEEDLYRMVARYFTDARYHYYPDWLAPQHFDVFIPSLNCAFEYQGVQHFEPVGFFGGDDAYYRRLKLDERKRHLSVINGVQLIEWIYSEPITSITLKSKLAVAGIEINILG